MSQQMPSSVQLTLSLEQLKILIHEAVQDAVRDAVRSALQEIINEDLNPEPTFNPEIAERLRRYRTTKPTGIPVTEIEQYGDLSDFPVDRYGSWDEKLSLNREDINNLTP